MASDPSSAPIDSQDLRLLRERSGLPWLQCKHYLQTWSGDKRATILAALKSQSGTHLHDPIEDDPAIRPLFLAICDEAKRDADARYEQFIAESKARPNSAAGHIVGRRALGHVMWERVKTLMKDRHDIEWLSPSDMNPWILFD